MDSILFQAIESHFPAFNLNSFLFEVRQLEILSSFHFS